MAIVTVGARNIRAVTLGLGGEKYPFAVVTMEGEDVSIVIRPEEVEICRLLADKIVEGCGYLDLRMSGGNPVPIESLAPAEAVH